VGRHLSTTRSARRACRTWGRVVVTAVDEATGTITYDTGTGILDGNPFLGVDRTSDNTILAGNTEVHYANLQATAPGRNGVFALDADRPLMEVHDSAIRRAGGTESQMDFRARRRLVANLCSWFSQPQQRNTDPLWWEAA
jgi:hypothetical protein